MTEGKRFNTEEGERKITEKADWLVEAVGGGKIGENEGMKEGKIGQRKNP